MPDKLHFTDSDEANELIAKDPMALLIGFVLDQQVTVQKAFAGPLALKERLGSIDADTVADADLDSVFRDKPAIHRFPGSMAERVHDLAVHIRDAYDGEAERVWTDAADSDALRENLKALPGFGDMKIKALGSRAGQALRRQGRRGPGALASDARRRRLGEGARGVSGGQARAQGRVVEGRGARGLIVA
jgi:uncharacterized HhH-GPD family protein